MVACGGLRERHEHFEFGAGGAGIDGFSGEAHAVEKIPGATCGDERAGGIGQYDVAVRAVFVAVGRAA